MFFNPFESQSRLFVHQKLQAPAGCMANILNQTLPVLVCWLFRAHLSYLTVCSSYFMLTREDCVNWRWCLKSCWRLSACKQMDLEINSQPRRGDCDSGQFTALLPPPSSLLPPPSSSRALQQTQRMAKVCWCWNKGYTLHADGCTGSS